MFTIPASLPDDPVALQLILRAAMAEIERLRLLIAGQDGFLDEARDVLRAGLASAAWITVDDTGARHQAGVVAPGNHGRHLPGAGPSMPPQAV